MSLKIIGPGFGRTGTHSLKLALEQLGFGPCHHMWEVRDNPDTLPDWQAAARGELPDWERVFHGYVSQVDWPGARYWRELIHHYPEAKVVLSIRHEQAWYDSMVATIGPFMWNYKTHPSERMRARAKMTLDIVEDQIFDGKLRDRDHAIAVFRQHVRSVQESVPNDRLLIYDVSEGWGPLCRFLEVATPNVSFPHSNSRDFFVHRRPSDA
jgi:hypothetical protein